MKVLCSCGQELNIPDQYAGKKGLCPGCKGTITVPALPPAGAEGAPVAASAVPASKEVASSEATCTVCQTVITAGVAVKLCPECRLPYHDDCWSDNGGCATYGCSQAPKTLKPAEPDHDEVSRRGWGDSKKCPYCGETIRAAALKCKFCHEVFDGADPITKADLRKKETQRVQRTSDRSKAIIYFICSVVSCAAPVTAIIGALWIFGDRKRFNAMDMTDRILIGCGFGISGLVSTVMVLGILVSATGA